MTLSAEVARHAMPAETHYSDDGPVPYRALCPHGQVADWTSTRDGCKTTADVTCTCPTIPAQRG